MTPDENERAIRTEPTLAVLFLCPTCDRAHHPKDLGSSLQCVSCERGQPSEDRPDCPDCTNVRVLPDDDLWFAAQRRRHKWGA